MPPRRSTRASSSSRLFDGSSEAGGPIDNVPVQSVHAAIGRGMSPGPARYSSAYGSPPTILPTRQNVARQRYNFSSALSHVVDAVEKDNEEDARARERAAEDEAQLRQRQRQRSETGSEEAPSATQDAAPAAGRAAQEADARTASRQSSAADVSHQSEETTESVELVRERADDREAFASNSSSQAPQQLPPVFADAEQIFNDTQISTPVLPARSTSVVSKTSNILHSILNSARRISTSRGEVDEDSVRQAYPQFHFIRPRPDFLPADTVDPPAGKAKSSSEPREPAEPNAQARSRTQAFNGTDEAESATSTPAPSSTRAIAKAIKSRIATPGPGLRNRRSLFKLSRNPSQDELANNGTDEDALASAKTYSSRRRTAQPQPRAQLSQLGVGERSERQSRTPQPSTSSRNRQSHDAARTSIPSTQSLKSGIWGYLWSFGEVTKALAMAITLIVLSAIAIRVFVISTSPSELYQGYRVDNRLHWYGSDWRSNLRQLVPYALVHPLGAISDEEFARMNGLILSHANEIAQMKYADRLHSTALERINHILPAMVHMELDKRGRPVISQEFWHALKDNIQADKDIFTLIWNKDGSMAVSDLQWTALKRQLQASGVLPDPDAKALSVSDVEVITENALSKSWESWLRVNQKKVKSVLGIDATQAPASPSSPPPQFDYSQVVERLTDDQIAKLARQMADSAKAKEILVPRQDFLRILQNTFVEHRLEIKGDIADLEARVVEIARVAASAVSSVRSSPVENSAGSSPTGRGSGSVGGGMTKKEIMSLVDQLVRKGISDAQLEAMSRGKIKSNWQTNLINQVNYLSWNKGAVVNRYFSSPSFTPHLPPMWSFRRLFSGLGKKIVRSSTAGSGSGLGGSSGSSDEFSTDTRPRPGSARGTVIFEQWQEDGDCWCAATASDSTVHSNSNRNNGDNTGKHNSPATIAIKLGLRIVPQYLVVEHINPSATLEPDAMPKDLEVWMQVTDYAQQRPLQDWSMNQFPDTAMDNTDENLFAWGFIKVGEFTFEADKARGGDSSGDGSGIAQVFRLSPELESLDAATDQVIVRAMSNHGNKDHTCFYRLRLYGQRRLDIVD